MIFSQIWLKGGVFTVFRKLGFIWVFWKHPKRMQPGTYSDGNRGNCCYWAWVHGGLRVAPGEAPEEPGKWARKGTRREEEVAVGVLEEKSKDPSGLRKGGEKFSIQSQGGPEKGHIKAEGVVSVSEEKKEDRNKELGSVWVVLFCIYLFQAIWGLN
jgi:hypothetical protein